MRGHYELKLSSGDKIQLQFCTWSLKRFCKLQGIGPAEIGDALNGTDSLEAIANLLRSAAEYPLYKQGLTPEFTDIDACDWIDEVGSIFQTDGQIIDYVKYIVSTTVLNIKGNTKEEKKKPNKAKLG